MALLSVSDVRCHFAMSKGETLRAVDGVSFDIEPGKTFALVGESGCGKSTLAKLVLGLEKLTSGEIHFDGENVARLDRAGKRRFRSRVQAVFQDPYSSLNPRLRIRTILSEPLTANGVKRSEIEVKMAEVLEMVGLPVTAQKLYPHEFSGGQRQRIAIARALILRPALIVLDEPISALDVSIRAQILNLLQDIQAELGLTYFLIAHDLALVEHTSDEIGVMYLGELVESGGSEAVFDNPQHPYTKALLDAVPRPDPSIPRSQGGIKGEIASALAPPPGCRFHPRCPHAMARCRAQAPVLSGTPQAVACHLYDDG
jgi:oligopeptide/dipeptide ABC transporter ATP-binding protein